MATKSILVHLDMNKNQIKQMVLENLAADPAGTHEGQEYWNTTNKLIRVYDGTNWGNAAPVSGATGFSQAATPALTIDDSDLANVTFTIALADGTNPGLLSNANHDLLANATALDLDNQLVKRNATGDVTLNSVTLVAAPTNATDAATKQYVDNLVASGMTIKGNIDASANPNYPAAVVGDAYYITVAGKIGGASGEVVEVGDLIINTTDAVAGDQATVGSDWIILQDNTGVASTTVAGLMRLATAAEVTAGVATDAVPTIADVKTMVDSANGIRGAELTLLAGSASFTVNHALNGNVLVQVFNNVTKDYVETSVTKVDTNNVTVSVNVAFTQDHTALCILV